MQYWKEGKVEFVGDPKEGTQTWTRKQPNQQQKNAR